GRFSSHAALWGINTFCVNWLINFHKITHSVNQKAALRILAELNGLKVQNSYRTLSENDENLVDFCSNDYLGIARTNRLRDKINEIFPGQTPTTGSGGSRLLTGNRKFYQEVESIVANYHCAEACLIFACGYMANLATLSTFPQRTDTILYDEYCHAFIRDGIRLSFAKSLSYRHNDYEDLYTKARAADGCVWIVTESVFSMDGDSPDFSTLSEICRSNDATLIVDEAHAIGVCGRRGEGLSQTHADMRIFGFGKAAGAFGGAVATSKYAVDYMINRARPFIFSTAPPPYFWQAIYAFYQLLPELEIERTRIFDLNSRFKSLLHAANIPFLGGTAGIFSVVFPGNDSVKNAARLVRNAGFDVRPILHPTVARNQERLRICLHVFNTEEQIVELTQTLKQAYENFVLKP
ncbi:MAG: pyridoxal phosphate-dependent aminotransferase family protein, partial [Bacteroidia bacterium]|nr:pyridoxal phosphate-dependent aminotransferase family protein [Bacteroidia bacterium]MDW8334289.1 pyridoxal phosphate-dependent aminotransferase family protein [Bacteroidia bacterium]